jgi:hypothetical protein
MPLLDDTDFKTRETGITYDQAGMDLVWNFVTSAGAMTQTAVTPTTGGDYDWAHQGDGMYSIEIPASGGASINNDTEGYGWFTGYATGVLPWRGPIVGFRDAGLNNLLVDSAYSATRGLAGTALPAAAADAAGGLPVSDAGGLAMDTLYSMAVSSAAWGSINSGISFRGTVTAADPGVSFTIGGLAGQGAGAFIDANTPWWAYVFRDAGGASAAPQGEQQEITGYTTATGLFTTDAFSTPVAVGDDIVVMTGRIASIPDILVDTAEIGAAGAGLTAIPWNASWDAEVESEVDDALGGGTGTALTAIPWNSDWDGEVQSEVDDALVVRRLDHLVAVADSDDPVDNSIMAKLAASDGDWSGFSAATDALEAIRDNQVAVTDITQRQLPDSVPADGTRPTIEQAIYMINQFLLERAVSGTTVTVKKADGSTTLLTLTLDDATDPTSITRAT